MKFFKNIAIISSLLLSSSLNAATITLDFTSGVFSDVKGTIDSSTGNPSPANVDTYIQDGFTLTTIDAGNHIDIGGVGASVGFHNGPSNPVSDNNLILTYSGGAFDLTGIDGFVFSINNPTLDFTGSNGSALSIGTAGDYSLSLLNVTSVVFSMSDVGSDVGWGSLTVNTAPSSVPVPAATWLFGSGLLGLVGLARRKA